MENFRGVIIFRRVVVEGLTEKAEPDKAQQEVREYKPWNMGWDTL